jgi:hypothetical protein
LQEFLQHIGGAIGHPMESTAISGSWLSLLGGWSWLRFHLDGDEISDGLEDDGSNPFDLL